jgi:autotransporter-associated beta strand protein
VNEGTLGFSTTTTVNGTGTVKVNSGGNLEIAYGTVAANITRGIVLNGGTLSSAGTASAADSNISLTASSVISGGNLTLNGNVTESGGSYGITINNNSTVNFTGATSLTGGLSVGSTAANATTVTLSSLTTAAGKEIRISNSTAAGTANQTLNVNGTVANSGTLSIGRVGVLNVNNGASWTQSGDMSVYGIGGYSATMNVLAGASFVSTGTNPILLNGAAANSGKALLNIAGTFTTSSGFEQTTVPTTGYGRVTLSGSGTLELGASVPQLTTTGVQFYVSGLFGAIDTKAFNTTLGANITGVVAGSALTKLGTGKLTLTGNNTYTGDTWLDEGTLAGNGTPTSKITAAAGTIIAPGASIGTFASAGADLTAGGTLAIEIDSTTATADKLVSTAAVDITGASVSFTEIGSGTIPAGTELVILDYTGATLTGTFTGYAEGASISVGANSFTLSYVDSSRVTLTSTTVGNAYDTWATTNITNINPGAPAGFDDDADGDGFANGLEWILGGGPLAQDAASLVTTTASAAGGLTLNFSRADESVGQAVLTVEYDADLAGAWTAVDVEGTPPFANGVTVNVTPGPPEDSISVNIPASNAVGGKLFGRLKAVQP